MLQIVRWNSFMAGLNYVARVSSINSVIGFLRLISYVAILLVSPSILYLMTFNVISSIALIIIYRRFIIKWFVKQGCKLKPKRKFDKEIFKSIWAATWKLGGIQWGNYLINYGTSIIVAQLNNPTLIANFLFTQRIFFIIRRIAEVPFYANIPGIYAMIVQKKFAMLKEKVSKYFFVALFIMSFSFLIIALTGNSILAFLDIDTRLVSMSIFFILALTTIFEVQAAMFRTIYISTNQVPFLIPILVSGAVIIVLGFIILPYYGLLGIVLVQFLIQLSFNYWFPVVLSFRLINWNITTFIARYL